MNSNTLVSIISLSFNHEAYINKSLDALLSQKTSFRFEIILHDDASTDGSMEIIQKYVSEYPSIIKPIYQIENQYSKGLGHLINLVFSEASSKYIAICECDDYWCDPFKLQKQVDFLEANSEFMGCSHNTKILRESRNEINDEFVVNNSLKDIYMIDDFTRGEAYFHTSSWVYRYADYKKEVISKLQRFEGDWFLSMVFASFGPIKYLDEVMSVYRIHDKGVWSELTQQEQVIKNLSAILKINKAFDYKYEENLMNLFTRSLINNFNILEIDKVLSFLEILEKNDFFNIIINLLKEINTLKALIDEKVNYIDEKHKIINWYEGVVKELQEKTIKVELKKSTTKSFFDKISHFKNKGF